MELLLTNHGLPIWMLITFGIVVFVLAKYAWKPILRTLAEREESIDGAIRLAEETKAEMAKMQSQNEDLLKQAREERDGILKDAKIMHDKIVADAKEVASNEGRKLIDKAKAEIEQEKSQAMNQLRKEVSTLSISMAEKVIGKKFENPSEQSQFVEDRLKDLETMPSASKN